mmetsp:Transcript_7531/g.12137  ORF Transcript_7531/g.12137 Transcript_7531/m.12137 type:complete len:292 (+) Transcript_7531:151-1026(+)|eukprot:CAMPEP_0203751454 /NCGR_PEP_ID=MMETSP0098-20131031/5526_1 /ASSEMBLY_ACC=CAM_ASM_000208 /TAXON_ID=96639 /ORGANISM=" , Strain NY0313808BC1" /LENGTH=291 /DNA_ID=CAMNT_0050641181 /DNA_START=97 /DNA_END=972 /DNA_ORIENTATION=-
MGNASSEPVNLLEKYDNFILDCDGVLWHSDTPIEGSIQAVQRMKNAGKRVIFVTNNATLSRTTYLQKFNRLGFKGIDISDINSSASAAAEHCHTKKYKKVFVCGESGLVEELQAKGIETLVDDASGIFMDGDFEKFKVDNDVQAVVMGWDRGFNFRKMCIASLYVQNGAELVECNPDTSVLVGGRKMPGNGCQVAAVKCSVKDVTGTKFALTGKPSKEFMEQLLKTNHFEAGKTLMIGDRLETDVQFGNGIVDTLMVLSGCSTQACIDNAKAGLRKPTHVSADLNAAFTRT